MSQSENDQSSTAHDPRTINRAIFPLHFHFGLSHSDPEPDQRLGMLIMTGGGVFIEAIARRSVPAGCCALEGEHISGHQAMPRGRRLFQRVIEVSQVPGSEVIIKRPHLPIYPQWSVSSVSLCSSPFCFGPGSCLWFPRVLALVARLRVSPTVETSETSTSDGLQVHVVHRWSWTWEEVGSQLDKSWQTGRYLHHPW